MHCNGYEMLFIERDPNPLHWNLRVILATFLGCNTKVVCQVSDQNLQFLAKCYMSNLSDIPKLCYTLNDHVGVGWQLGHRDELIISQFCWPWMYTFGSTACTKTQVMNSDKLNKQMERSNALSLRCPRGPLSVGCRGFRINYWYFVAQNVKSDPT